MARKGKKQKASSKYKRLDLNPEEEAVYAAANANKNNTTEEEERAKNHAAMVRDNAIEFADYVKDHKNMIDSSMVASGETPQVNNIPTIPQSPADVYASELEKKAEEVQKEIDGTSETENADNASASADNTANAAITDSVTEAVTPKKDDPPEVRKDKNKYNKAMMSIWDAYRAGEISKETAGYFTIDAIATLAKNLGRSIGNVGAQFSGGTIDNGHDESKWGQRQNALLNEEIGKETESLGGAAGRQAESENIANLEAQIRAKYSTQMLDLEIKNLENEVKKSGIDVTKAENSQALIEHIKSDKDYAKSPLKMLFVGILSQIGVGGAVNSGVSALEKLALLKGK